MTTVILTNLIAATICVVPAISAKETGPRDTDLTLWTIRVILTSRYLFDTIPGSADHPFTRAVAVGTTFSSLSTGAIDADLTAGTIRIRFARTAFYTAILYAPLLAGTLVVCPAFRALTLDAEAVTAVPARRTVAVGTAFEIMTPPLLADPAFPAV